MKGTYTVQGPTDKFIDFVTNNFEDCNVLMQKPGDHVIEITVFDYELNAYDGVVGVSDYFKPNKRAMKTKTIICICGKKIKLIRDDNDGYYKGICQNCKDNTPTPWALRPTLLKTLEEEAQIEAK